MTTIPLKPDGSPDWERMFGDAEYSLRQCGYTTLHPDQIRIGYIAALERCAREIRATCRAYRKHEKECATEDGKISCRQQVRDLLQIAATIRQWIEKEKANERTQN